MTKRDNELTRHELLDKRVKQLFEKFDLHRGQLPQDLLTAVEGVRKAHEMKDAPPPVVAYGRKLDPHEEQPVVHVSESVPVVSKPDSVDQMYVPAVATDAPVKPGDQT
jgi:hypothetical protein